ncbi:MAG: hypothetical protein CMI78_00400 [Candidatus Pelagibacter sp.]|nr:hypothetical protein [Candidatus Pelagibacter sp.]
MLIKNNYTTLFYIFLLSHLIIWTLIPSISNINLPLDTIEALAWSSNLSWGYSKHPPVSAFMTELIFNFFGNQDWAYYLLSQLCIIVAFIYVWKFSNYIFHNKLYSLCSVLLLEGIFFYNFTSPEFNVNVCQLPFWALVVFYSWKSINYEKTSDLLLLGIFMSIGFLTKYLFIYLILTVKIIFILNILKKKNFKIKLLIPGAIFVLILLPHIIWLFQNNFTTITYALNRTGMGEDSLINHFYNPFLFLIKQIGILIPIFVMLITFIKIKKIKFNYLIKDNNFLLMINIIPIILIFLTSIILGAKIRTMWMTPFYLFLGVLLIQIFKEYLNKNNLKKFLAVFVVLFILSPISYIFISLSNEFKRTDYPGREISELVQRRWDKNFSNNISIVVGDEWYAGNLSYHLSSRPTWYNTIENDLSLITSDTGVIYIGNPKILKKFCPGIYGTIKPIGICMIGAK